MKRALISVYDKSGLDELVGGLYRFNEDIEILSTGGTARYLEDNGFDVADVSLYTKAPEMFGGRVKTLHPRVHGGILYKRGEDDEEAEHYNVEPIDLVVCNLYPFEDVVKRGGELDELVENIDIGGPTMIMSSVKNYKDVAVVVDPDDYSMVVGELNDNGELSEEFRKMLAVKAVNHVANYRSVNAVELGKRLIGEYSIRLKCGAGKELRYGENWHQKARVYWAYNYNDFVQVSGKEMSYNNYLDVDAAMHAAWDLKKFGEHGVAVIKHTNPCGYATGESIEEAFAYAWAGDPKSAFGSVCAFTSKVTMAVVDQIRKKKDYPDNYKFVEVFIAPDYDKEVVEWASKKRKGLRLISSQFGQEDKTYRSINCGMLLQDNDLDLMEIPIEDLFKELGEVDGKRLGLVTEAKPTLSKEVYCFAMTAAKHLKSNAIAIAREYKPGFYQMVGYGAGQCNRVDSVCDAKERSCYCLNNQRLVVEDEIKNCVMASDSFFPFDDCVKQVGGVIKNIIHPGGSNNDKASEDVCNELGVAMVYTGVRHFKH
ncbi:bifunctional phosphoribosylaminoimidazolecarboxamide formyltransferase/IMP cyclohydrolase [Candidatus Woesearchaeota archaeon]|nr:bifunctional phosphoribosylaminoimidazolecarboxamide formyltransferase/IMP cyclohydrolase [Candidatus Woesearchaeota archaeon]